MIFDRGVTATLQAHATAGSCRDGTFLFRQESTQRMRHRGCFELIAPAIKATCLLRCPANVLGITPSSLSDRGHSLRSLLPPLAAFPSLPYVPHQARLVDRMLKISVHFSGNPKGGSDATAAGGRQREQSEWPRSIKSGIGVR